VALWRYSQEKQLSQEKEASYRKVQRDAHQKNRTGSLARNKNSYNITQSVMAKNRSALKLIHYDQK